MFTVYVLVGRTLGTIIPFWAIGIVSIQEYNTGSQYRITLYLSEINQIGEDNK